jgi:hypothetical protein
MASSVHRCIGPSALGHTILQCLYVVFRDTQQDDVTRKFECLPRTGSPAGFDLTRKRAMRNRGKDGLNSSLLAELTNMVVSAM